MGWIKNTLLTGLAAATIVGTYSARQGDLPPIYTIKDGYGGGICISACNYVRKDAVFDGMILSAFNMNDGKVRGLEASLISFPKYEYFNDGEIDGLKLAIINGAGKVKGVQVGIINLCDSLDDGVQIGVINASIKDNKWGIGFNYNFGGER